MRVGFSPNYREAPTTSVNLNGARQHGLFKPGTRGTEVHKDLAPQPGDFDIVTLRIIDAPVLDGALIRRGHVVRHPGMDGPLAFLGGVAIAPLLSAADFPVPEQDLLRLWSERIGSVEAARVLAWLRRSGLLIAA